MKFSFISISLFVAVLSLAACGTKHTEGDGHGAEAQNEHGPGGHAEHENLATVSLSAEQIKAVKIQIGTIEKKQLTAALKLNGVLKVPNENMAQVTSIFPGVVKTLLVQAGSKVKKGQTSPPSPTRSTSKCRKNTSHFWAKSFFQNRKKPAKKTSTRATLGP